MLLRLALFIVFGIVVARAFWRVIDNIVAGIRGAAPGGKSQVASRAVAMVRDPVCGTFVLPDRAVTITDGRARVFFCSLSCRDKYQTRTA